ncbi:unnamed protein product [Mortierella alpina]
MQVQRFRWKDTVEVIEVRKDASGRHYSLIEDVQDLFDGAFRFKINGVSILFLQDETGKRYEPRRIGHYPDNIIDVITVHDQQKAAYSIPRGEQLPSNQEPSRSDQEPSRSGQDTVDARIEELAITQVSPKSPALVQASAAPPTTPLGGALSSCSSPSPSLSGDESTSILASARKSSPITTIAANAPTSHSATLSSVRSTSSESTQATSDLQLQPEHSNDEQSAHQHAQVMAQSINPYQIEDGSTASPGEEPSGFLEKAWNWDP